MRRTLLALTVAVVVAGTFTATGRAEDCHCDRVNRLVPVAQPAVDHGRVSLPEARALARVLGWQQVYPFSNGHPVVHVGCRQDGRSVRCHVAAQASRASLKFRVRVTRGRDGTLIPRASRLRVR